MAEPLCETRKPGSSMHDLNHCCLFSTPGYYPDGKEIGPTMKPEGLHYLATTIYALAIKVNPGSPNSLNSDLPLLQTGPKAQLLCVKMREALSRQEGTSGLTSPVLNALFYFLTRRENKYYLCGSLHRTQGKV